MFELTEYTNDKDFFGYSFTISNPDEYYELGKNSTRYCILHIRIGARSWFWKISEIFKPKKEWVDTSQYSWSTSENKGYWNYIPYQYGFHILDGYVHIHYGIQPGFWSSTDKKNSDHTKLFEIPWRQKTYIHEAFFTPNWEFYDLVKPEKSGRINFNRLELAKNEVPKIKFKFNDFDGEEIIATCHISERCYEYGTGWFKWLKYFIKSEIYYSLEIDFNKEVGYEKGSWKGGTLGHAINIEYKESPLEAFKRYGSEDDRYRNYGIKNRNFSNIQMIYNT
jgi:hypothetical protein